MKHFKDSIGIVWAFAADGSQDAFIAPSLIPISDAEAEELRKPPPLTIAQQNENIKAQIAAIEATRQPRAIREYALSGETSYLEAVDADIAALRVQLQ